MDSFELNSHSFIVKVWVEENVDGGIEHIWRGTVTHVPSGRRGSLKNVDDIARFIMPYLQEMGIQFQPKNLLTAYFLGLRKLFKR